MSDRTTAAAAEDDGPGERARYLLALTAARLARLASVSAVPLVTLAVLAAVDALVASPTVAAGGAPLPVTRAVAAAVAFELVRRLCALNAGG